jgi:hypothetical protein
MKEIAMVVRGQVKDGKIVLEPGAALPEGIAVEIRTIENGPAIPTLGDRFKNVAGRAEGLPTDLAANHDHYLHGHAKRPS